MKKIRKCHYCKFPMVLRNYIDYHHVFEDLKYKHRSEVCTNPDCSTSYSNLMEGVHQEKLLSLTYLHGLMDIIGERKFKLIKACFEVSQKDLEASLALQKSNKLKPAPEHDPSKCPECKREDEEEKIRELGKGSLT